MVLILIFLNRLYKNRHINKIVCIINIKNILEIQYISTIKT